MGDVDLESLLVPLDELLEDVPLLVHLEPLEGPHLDPPVHLARGLGLHQTLEEEKKDFDENFQIENDFISNLGGS